MRILVLITKLTVTSHNTDKTHWVHLIFTDKTSSGFSLDLKHKKVRKIQACLFGFYTEMVLMVTPAEVEE